MYCLIKSLRSLFADSERAKEKILSSVRFSAVAVREIVCGLQKEASLRSISFTGSSIHLSFGLF